MTDSTPLVSKLEEIAQNLWWCWQPDGWLVFRDLDPVLWHETNHNPIAFLERLDAHEIEERAQRTAVAGRIQNAHRKLTSYLNRSGADACMRAGPLHQKPVAYFCAEFGLH